VYSGTRLSNLTRISILGRETLQHCSASKPTYTREGNMRHLRENTGELRSFPSSRKREYSRQQDHVDDVVPDGAFSYSISSARFRSPSSLLINSMAMTLVPRSGGGNKVSQPAEFGALLSLPGPAGPLRPANQWRPQPRRLTMQVFHPAEHVSSAWKKNTTVCLCRTFRDSP
jgi:hypothetical protein